MAGYSKTPLPKKLGIKEGHGVLVQGASPPPLGRLPERTRLVRRRSAGRCYDVILAFCRNRKALDMLLARCLEHLPPAGALWLCWPKKTSGLQTDIAESEVRGAGLAAGIVDVKICAVDDTWSALKFVVRVKDRPTWPQ